MHRVRTPAVLLCATIVLSACAAGRVGRPNPGSSTPTTGPSVATPTPLGRVGLTAYRQLLERKDRADDLLRDALAALHDAAGRANALPEDDPEAEGLRRSIASFEERLTRAAQDLAASRGDARAVAAAAESGVADGQAQAAYDSLTGSVTLAASDVVEMTTFFEMVVERCRDDPPDGWSCGEDVTAIARSLTFLARRAESL